MKFLKENNSSEKYYRLEIDGMGSFYRSIDKIIKELRDSEDDDDYDLGNNIDGLLGDLEAELPYPDNIKDNRIKFAYTRHGYNNLKNIDSYLSNNKALDDLKELLSDYGVNLIIKELIVNSNCIVYKDDYQIGYIE